MINWLRRVLWVLLAAWGILNVLSVYRDYATYQKARVKLMAFGAGYREGLHWAAYGKPPTHQDAP